MASSSSSALSEKEILFLRSKLEETWNGSTIVAALNEKLLKKVSLSDIDLDSRKRLLMALPDMRHKAIQSAHPELARLLEEAVAESDSWVQTIESMLHDFPASRSINTPPIAAPVVTLIIEEMRAFEEGSRYADLDTVAAEAAHCCDAALSDTVRAAVKAHTTDCGFKKRGDTSLTLELRKFKDNMKKALAQRPGSATPGAPRSAVGRRMASVATVGPRTSSPKQSKVSLQRRLSTQAFGARRASRTQMMGKDESLAVANTIVEKKRKVEEDREAERARKKSERDQERERKRLLLEQKQKQKLHAQEGAGGAGAEAPPPPGTPAVSTASRGEEGISFGTGEDAGAGDQGAQAMPANPQHHRIFEQANALSAHNRRRVVDFLDGKAVDPLAGQPVEKILMNEQQIAAPEGSIERVVVRIHMEIDFDTRRWKRSRTRVKVKVQ